MPPSLVGLAMYRYWPLRTARYRLGFQEIFESQDIRHNIADYARFIFDY